MNIKEKLLQELRDQFKGKDLMWGSVPVNGEVFASFSQALDQVEQETVAKIHKALIFDWSIFFEIGRLQSIGHETGNEELVTMGMDIKNHLGALLDSLSLEQPCEHSWKESDPYPGKLYYLNCATYKEMQLQQECACPYHKVDTDTCFCYCSKSSLSQPQEKMGQWIDKKCPKCGSHLLGNGTYEWCSLIGCDYGLSEDVKSPPSTPEHCICQCHGWNAKVYPSCKHCQPKASTGEKEGKNR